MSRCSECGKSPCHDHERRTVSDETAQAIDSAWAVIDAERAKVVALTKERDEALEKWKEYGGIMSAVCDHVSRSPWTIAGQTLVEAIQAIEAHSAALTNALQALVESMPECWRCEELATHWRAGSYVNALRLEAGLAKLGNEQACSKHSDGGPEMNRAHAIRATVALLAKQREET